MSGIGYIKNTVNTRYGDSSINYIRDNGEESVGYNVIDVAGELGVSAGAIAGAMVEENHSYDFLDELLDYYAQSGLSPQEADASLTEAIKLGDVGLVAWVADMKDMLFSTHRTHEEWLADYESVTGSDGEVNVEPTESNKVLHPVLIDAGQGNFKISTAIRLVNDYAIDYPNLELGQYLNDYGKLVNDLIDATDPLTAKLYGLYMKEAEAFYRDQNA